MSVDALIAAGRFDEAYSQSKRLADAPEAGEADLFEHAKLLKQLKYPEEAMLYHHKAVSAFPRSARAWHNLAASLGDQHYADATIDAVETAIKLGESGPQTLIIKARALFLLNRFEAAQAVYEQCLKLDPGMAEAVQEYAQLIWMQTADVAAALAIYDTAIKATGNPLVVRAKALFIEYLGDTRLALDTIRPVAETSDAPVIVLSKATDLALDAGEDDLAQHWASRAYERDNRSVNAIYALFCVLVARGEALPAAHLARYFCDMLPLNQLGPALMYTAARLRNHPTASELYDYDNMVGIYPIATPSGWTSLEHYLKDLEAALRKAHSHLAHPLNQSIRGGSQTQLNLLRHEDPAIKAYFSAIDPVIRNHMALIGNGADVLRFRNTHEYRIQGAWSIWMKSAGFHVDHLHNRGWLSSAFYVKVPEACHNTETKAGWLRLGKPVMRCKPQLEPERYIQPRPGHLVLFPSYMWHGTNPFNSPEERVTIAIDIVPPNPLAL